MFHLVLYFLPTFIKVFPYTGPWWSSGLERRITHYFVLELKVEGSNPALSRSFFSARDKSDKNELINSRINPRVNAHAQSPLRMRVRTRMRTRNLDFR